MNKTELVEKLRNKEEVNLNVRDDDWGYAPMTWKTERIDLTNVDLSTVDFSGKKISYVDFSGSRLDSANFNNTDIRTCRFDGCNFENATFERATIDNVIMDDVIMENVSFSSTNIKGININRALMKNIDFTHASKKVNINITNTKLLMCDFTEVTGFINVTSSIVKDCEFKNTKFITDDDEGASNFNNSFIENTHFIGTDFSYFTYLFDGSIINDSNFFGAMPPSVIKNATILDSDLSRMNIEYFLEIDNCRLTDVGMMGLKNGSLYIVNSDIERCAISNLKLSQLKIEDSDIDSTTFDDSSIDYVLISKSSFELCSMDNVVMGDINVNRTVRFIVDDVNKYSWARNKGIAVIEDTRF